MSVVLEHMIALRHANTDGSFTCGCISGYLLDVNGSTCNGMYKLLVLFW